MAIVIHPARLAEAKKAQFAKPGRRPRYWCVEHQTVAALLANMTDRATLSVPVRCPLLAGLACVNKTQVTRVLGDLRQLGWFDGEERLRYGLNLRWAQNVLLAVEAYDDADTGPNVRECVSCKTSLETLQFRAVDRAWAATAPLFQSERQALSQSKRQALSQSERQALSQSERQALSPVSAHPTYGLELNSTPTPPSGRGGRRKAVGGGGGFARSSGGGRATPEHRAIVEAFDVRHHQAIADLCAIHPEHLRRCAEYVVRKQPGRPRDDLGGLLVEVVRSRSVKFDADQWERDQTDAAARREAEALAAVEARAERTRRVEELAEAAGALVTPEQNAAFLRAGYLSVREPLLRAAERMLGDEPAAVLKRAIGFAEFKSCRARQQVAIAV